MGAVEGGNWSGWFVARLYRADFSAELRCEFAGRFEANMRKQYTLALLSVLVVACQEQGQGGGAVAKTQRAAVIDVQDPDILPLSARSVVLEDTVAILESDYLGLISAEKFAAGEKFVDLQLRLASDANSTSALGIVGEKAERPELEGKRIIVLHNPRSLGDGDKYQATSFSVVNGQLYGSAEWGIVNPSLHFGSKEQLKCDTQFRGCSPLAATDLRPQAFANWESGGMGFSPDVRLDAESAVVPTNQTGRTIELWSIPNPDVASLLWPGFEGFVGNRFACAGAMTEEVAAECDARSEGDASPEPASVETPVGERVAVISEADFQSALLRGELAELKPEKSFAELAATIATSLNDASSRGIRADVSRTDEVEADVLLVAKSPRIKGEALTADRLFVVPGPVRLRVPSGQAGTNAAILGLDPSFFSMGICGPELFPGLELKEGTPGLPQPLTTQAGYGSDRQLRGLSRATIRIPTIYQGRQTIQMLACSHFVPPRPPPPPVTPVFQQELCNGLDDNGNGRIDEGGCFLNACSGCTPVPATTCGARRCVSVPDGCNGLLVCPCP